MKKSLMVFVLLFCFSAGLYSQVAPPGPVVTTIRLPEPVLNGKVSLEQAIKNRRSIRQFTTEPLKITQIGQLCWSAQGITDEEKGLRAAPSAGAIYPMQLYVVLADGLYLYLPKEHSLEKQINGDIRPMLRTATFGQQVIQDSPCSFVIAGSIKKIEAKYRGRGEKFTYLEAGHIAQNIHLQAVSLGLGSVPLGAFDSKSVTAICKLPEGLEALYLVCTGNPTEKPLLEPVIASVPAAVSAVQSAGGVQTKRVVIIVASKYFNDTEYFGVEGTLQISGVQPVIASSATGEIKGIKRNTITATMLVKDIKVDDYDAFVFIGGPGAKEYFDNKDVLNLVRSANKENKILAAIGVAPAIFAYADIVKDRNVASFTSQRRKLINAGAEWKNTSLEIDGNMITASGPEADQLGAGSPESAQRFGTTVLRMLRQQTN
jgi:SagB-type dehydrogenase family enzyme